MEVDDVPADIAVLKSKVSGDTASTEGAATLCNGDVKENANGVNGDNSNPGSPSMDEDENESGESDTEGKTNSVNGDRKSEVNGKSDKVSNDQEDSIMELDDDDDDHSKDSSVKDTDENSSDSRKVESNRKSDVDETSQDSVLSGDKSSKANDDSECEMIEDDESSNDKTEEKEEAKSAKEKEDKSDKESSKEDDDKGKEGEKDKPEEEKEKKDEIKDTSEESNDSSKEKEKSLADVDPATIETKAEAAARLKAEAANKAKFAVMDKPAEITDMRPMAHLLHDIGMDLCRETVYSHLIKVQNKKLSQNKLGEKETEQLEKLKEAHVDIKKKNEAFTMEAARCPICSFKTESRNVLEWHLEFAHGQDEESYACSFCKFSTKMPGVFFFHMENEHKRKGRIYMRAAQFSCPLCPFENNKRATMTKHKLRCEKVFSMKRNLEPSPTDCDIPLKKTKKQLAAVAASQNQAQARITRQQPAIISRANPPPLQPRPVGTAILNTGGRATVAQTISQVVRPGMPATTNTIQLAAQAIAQQAAQNVLNQQRKVQQTTAPIPLSGQIPGGMIPMYPPGTTQAQILAGTVRPTHYAIGNQLYQIVQTRGQFMLQPVQQPGQFQIRQAAKPVQARPTAQQKAEIDLKSALEAVHKNVERKQAEERRKKELAAKNAKGGAAPQFEICEICGGFVKDRDSLHIHFFWAHKVEINKEVFQQHQPHLICDICRSRFWTFQGLHRHRQISHGAGGNKANSTSPRGSQNLYKCYMCGVQVAYLATHLSEKHNVSIQQMFKAKKCYVCGLNFDNQKSLEKHLVKNHRELLTPQKFKPQQASPIPTGLFHNTGTKKSKTFQPECSICDIKFSSLEKFSQHCNDFHIFKCYRCGEKWSSQELLQKHMSDAHRSDTDECQICKQKVKIGRPYIRHMRNSHLKENSVVLVRLDPKLVEADNERWTKRKAEYEKQAAEEAAKKAEAAAKRAAEAAKKAEAEKDDVIMVPPKKKSDDVICLDDSDDDQPPPAKKPALDENKDGANTEETKKDQEESDDEANISAEVLEVDGEKIVIEKQDEADTSNNSGASKEDDEKVEIPDDDEEERKAEDKEDKESSDVEMIEDDDDDDNVEENDIETVKSNSVELNDDDDNEKEVEDKNESKELETETDEIKEKRKGDEIDLEDLMEVEES